MIRFKTIRNPSHALSPSEQTSLLDEILSLNMSLSDNESFQHNWLKRSASFMADTELLDLAYDKGKLVGHYSSKQLKIDGREITYIDTLTVHPRLQTSGLGSVITARVLWHGFQRSRGRAFMMGSRTEAPHLIGVISTAFGQKNYYPCFDPNTSPTPELSSTATAMAQELWPECEFCPETGVLKEAYGGSFLPIVRSRCRSVQEHFDKHVNSERGDAIVQVIWLRLATLPTLIRSSSALVLRLLSKGRIRWNVYKP